jgi:hypothetical protein
MKYVKYRTNKKLTEVFDNWSALYINNQSSSNNFITMNQNIEDRIWGYIDGLSNEDEKSAIEKMIATNAEWRTTYQELLQAHQLIGNITLEEPSLRFTKNVMEEIAKYQVAPATRNYINKKIIWGISGFFLTMIIGLLIYCFAQLSWTGGSSSSGLLSEYNADKLNWSKLFNNTYLNIFVMINVVLGLMLLDMYLRRKKQQPNHKEA